jgi:transcription factor IIIB subunit 2
MDRAWISTGRRPNGLCGSAILIAARVLGFKRSTSQIARVAHICEETLRKRLCEFKGTQIAQLTFDEIKSIEQKPQETLEAAQVEESMDPPSFTRKILQEELNISESDLSKY